NLFQHPFLHFRRSELVEGWTLKQVQGDDNYNQIGFFFPTTIRIWQGMIRFIQGRNLCAANSSNVN
ncbi:MAG: hypothetical protein KDE55_18365, partial [Novosphingobium sp.]|nr:hypothetical protein [Novosphingobium sp.]